MSLVKFAIGGAVAGKIGKSVLRAVGVGVVSLAGGFALVSSISAFAHSELNTLPSAVQNMLGLLRFDLCVNVLVFFLNLRLTIMGGKRFGLL